MWAECIYCCLYHFLQTCSYPTWNRFYTECLGMKVLRQRNIPEEKYIQTLSWDMDLRCLILLLNLLTITELTSMTLELVFGHLGIVVEDVGTAVDLIKGKGGKVTREPGPVKGGSTVITLVEDPDGYTFELLEKGRDVFVSPYVN